LLTSRIARWQDSNTVPTYLEGLGFHADETEKKTTTWGRTQKPGKIHSVAARHCDRLSFFQPHHQVRTHMGKKNARIKKNVRISSSSSAHSLPPATSNWKFLHSPAKKFWVSDPILLTPVAGAGIRKLIQSRVRSSSLG
jgi:hypothetical protein